MCLRWSPCSPQLMYVQVLWPSCSVRDLRLWSEVYLCGGARQHSSEAPLPALPRGEEQASCPASSSATPSPATPASGCSEAGTGISKTRSCEDLSSVNTAATQCHARRSSHPSLTESHLADLLSVANETESVFMNGHCNTESEDVADSPSPPPATSMPPPPPPLPPPPVTQSVESSTDTLVPTMEQAPVTVAAVAASLPEQPCLSPPPQSSCHVCASSRRFLLESSVLELCGGGSDICVQTEEEASPLRPATSNQSQGQLEVDGLASLHSDVQARLHHIYADFQSQIEALQRELHTTRLALIQQVCHHCGPPTANGDLLRLDDTGSLPESLDGNGVHSGDIATHPAGSRPSSDTSWETVDDRDTLPTLWMPDHAVGRCMGCDTSFWIGRRKHHCRSCGRIFCADCSWNTAPLPAEQLYEPVRVCSSCYRQITTVNVASSSSQCKQPSPHDKLHSKSIVSTAST
ncbi:hypothetical protein B566_EDAN007322 [Ephemera danica]|nr:hypothetical protein B566_EDAN007322 [Ephemera danica]